MRRWVTGLIMAVLLLSVFSWGYWERNNRERLANALEGEYQREFYTVLGQAEQLESLISKSLVSGTAKHQVFYLGEVWSRAETAQSSLGQLPFLDLNLSASRKFLAQMGDYCYSLAGQVASGRDLKPEQRSQLQRFYDETNKYTQTLHEAEAEFNRANFRWTSAITKPFLKTARAEGGEFQGLENFDQRIQGLPVLIYDGPFSEHWQFEKPKGLTGERISQSEAEALAERFVNQDFDGVYRAVDSEKIENSKIEAYSFTLDGQNQPGVVKIDLSTKGGHVLWMLNSRIVGEVQLSNEEVAERARSFLVERGFENIEEIYAINEANTRVIVFVAKDNEVRLYPDQLKVQVALDNGEIVGFNALNYLTTHYDRRLPKPELGIKEAEQKLNPRLEVTSRRLALIPLRSGKEVLTYEFRGRLNDENYLIYINAQNGEEEEILKIIKAENGEMTI